MIARGGNARGVVGVIPQGPKGSNVCLRVAKVVPDGEGAARVSALLEGILSLWLCYFHLSITHPDPLAHTIFI